MPPAQVPSSGSRRRKEQRYRSVISDIFDGSILSLVQCLTCDRVGALGEGRDAPGSSRSLGVGRWFSAWCPLPFSGGGPRLWASRVLGSGAGSLPHTCPLVAGVWGANSGWSGQGGTLGSGDPG